MHHPMNLKKDNSFYTNQVDDDLNDKDDTIIDINQLLD